MREILIQLLEHAALSSDEVVDVAAFASTIDADSAPLSDYLVRELKLQPASPDGLVFNRFQLYRALSRLKAAGHPVAHTRAPARSRAAAFGEFLAYEVLCRSCSERTWLRAAGACPRCNAALEVSTDATAYLGWDDEQLEFMWKDKP